MGPAGLEIIATGLQCNAPLTSVLGGMISPFMIAGYPDMP